MRSDKELLELAAKAIGVSGSYQEAEWADWGGKTKTSRGIGKGVWVGPLWNSLDDRDAATQLMIELRIPVWFDATSVIAGQKECGSHGYRVEFDDRGVDYATRRALTQYAAAFAAGEVS